MPNIGVPELLIVLVIAGASVRLVHQYERGVVLRFGRLLPEHVTGRGAARVDELLD